MKAVYIYPEDIGAATEYSVEWITFCKCFGYTEYNAPKGLLLTEIQINNK